MSQTIVVLGTNAGQADLIREMKRRGWRVIGVSPVRGEPGQAFCDVVEHENIVDLDAMSEIIQRHQADLVYSISSDIAMVQATSLAERAGLPHFFDSSFVAMLDDKAALRVFLNTGNLSPVPFQKVTDPAQLRSWNTFPCMVKPADAQGQRGVRRIDRPEDLAAAVDAATAASRTGTAIVEAFLDGVEISVNVLLCGGEIKLQVLSERVVHGPEAPGVPRSHLIPAQHVSPESQLAALTQVRAIVAAMGQTDGPLYFQMIITPHGPRVVEIAPRLDGCHMWRLIKAAEGVDLLAMTMDCLTGAAAVPTVPPLAPGSAGGSNMGLFFQQMPPGRAFDPADFPVPEDTTHHEYRYQPGEEVRPVNGTLEVVGYWVGPA